MSPIASGVGDIEMGKTALQWATEPLRRYAQFQGRASRSEYWWFTLAVFIITLLLNVLELGLGTRALGAVFSLAILVPSLAVGVRRLHDIDRSGWWILLPLAGAVPVGIGMGMTGAAQLTGAIPSGSALAALGVGGLVLLALSILVLVWYCTRGTMGPNRFGEDPFDGVAAG